MHSDNQATLSNDSEAYSKPRRAWMHPQSERQCLSLCERMFLAHPHCQYNKTLQTRLNCVNAQYKSFEASAQACSTMPSCRVLRGLPRDLPAGPDRLSVEGLCSFMGLCSQFSCGRSSLQAPSAHASQPRSAVLGRCRLHSLSQKVAKPELFWGPLRPFPCC